MPVHRSESEFANRPALVDARLAVFHFVAALVFLLVAIAGGIVSDLPLAGWNPLDRWESFAPGQWKMMQTNALAYGFLMNGFFGCLHWVVPRLTLLPLAGGRLPYFIFFLWQAVGVGTIVGILAGDAQGVSWGETPVVIDPWALVALLLMSIAVVAPILRAKARLVLPLEYFLVAGVWLPLTYALGNFAPQYFVSGVAAGVVAGLFIQDLHGLCFAALGWGTIYYIVPVIIGKPVWSRRCACVGFWGLAIFGPVCGVRNLLFAPIPLGLQIFAVVATALFELSVIVAIINLFATFRRAGTSARQGLPARWIYTGVAFYFLASLLGAAQTILPLHALTQFTELEEGQIALLVSGVFVFWLIGDMIYLFPQLLRRPWYSRSLCQWHYWLSTAGAVLMFAGSALAGVSQGYWWRTLQPWETSLDGARPFLVLRLLGALAMFAAQLCFFYNLFRTWKACLPALEQTEAVHLFYWPGTETSAGKARVALIAGFTFAVAVGFNVWATTLTLQDAPEQSVKDLPNPNLMYEVEDLARRYPETFQKYYGEPTRDAASAALRLGRAIYVGEGCWQCHSQLVRAVSTDARRWGPVAQAWEYQNELQRPAMFGTRRIGPDLSREGGRRSNDWQATHLYQPTLTTTGSPMPEYTWLFDGAPNQPNQRGLAVITYLQWLGSWLNAYPYYEDYQSIEQLEHAAPEAGAGL